MYLNYRHYIKNLILISILDLEIQITAMRCPRRKVQFALQHN